jgi:hypothetical protein
LSKQRFRSMGLVAGLVLLLLTSVVYAQEEYADPVMEAAREAGLIEEIGLSQTVGDVTVTLDWAYADTQRIMLGYTLHTAEDINPNDLFSPFMSSPRLSDGEGASFSYASSIPIPGDQSNEMVMVIDYYTQAILPGAQADEFVVDNEYFNSPPDELDLQFELNYGDFTAEANVPPASLDDSNLEPGDYVDAIGPFVFDFTVPLYPAVVVAPMETVEVDGIEMTLEQVSITPTKTSARVCYDMPDARDWMPEASVEVGGEPGRMSGAALVGGKEAAADTEHRCRDLSYDVFYDTEPTTMTVNVDYLTASMTEGPDDWERIRDVLAEQGIEIEVNFSQGEGGGGVGIEVISIPDGVDFNEAVNEAREMLGDRLAGPWTFTVELP